jgi:hypothetical protein
VALLAVLAGHTELTPMNSDIHLRHGVLALSLAIIP